jgi:transcriptional regulator with XRE-family HTH domain
LNQLSAILKAARKKKGWTQAETAIKLGIKQRRYGFYETGQREPDYELLMKMAEVLDIPALAQDVPRELPKSVDPTYVLLLEKDRDLFETSLRNNLNLITANLTELLKAQRYDRAQLTTLLAVTSRTLAVVQKKDVETVFAETNKAVNDLIREQM